MRSFQELWSLHYHVLESFQVVDSPFTRFTYQTLQQFVLWQGTAGKFFHRHRCEQRSIILRKQISLSVRYYHLQIYKAYSNSNLRDQKVHKTGLLVLGVWILDILTSWHKPDACSLCAGVG